MKTQTIDVLLLQTLAGGPAHSRGLSRMWGEDRVRVEGWLDKFCKLGLCVVARTPWTAANPQGINYVGRPARIEEYLAKMSGSR